MPQKISTCALTALQVSKIVGYLVRDYLGTYTYSNGSTRFAVAVNRPAENKRVDGLELVVDAAARSANREGRWTVHFLDRSDKLAVQLDEVAEILRTSFNSGINVLYLPANTELEAISQLRVGIPFGALLVWRKRLLSAGVLSAADFN